MGWYDLAAENELSHKKRRSINSAPYQTPTPDFIIALCKMYMMQSQYNNGLWW